MDPRYQWPPQGPPNGQYPPPVPPPNSYPANGYMPQYPPQPMAQPFPQSQPASNHPRVVITPRASQYAPMQDPNRVQQRVGQPQVVIPSRNPGGLPQMSQPRIRQVQVSVQRPVQRVSSAGVMSRDSPNARQAQTPVSKSVQRSQSFQENPPKYQQQQQQQQQQRTPSVSSSNQHRAPLQPHATPQNRTSSQTPSSQHRPSSLPHPSSQSRPHPQVVIKKHTPQSTPTPARTQNAPPAQPLPADFSVMLLSMADEYIKAARGMGPIAAMINREAEKQQYYKLMATGLGCMEAVLKKYNQQPREEAKLRLRYASLLVEETDNDVEIEDVLIKGIALCQRSRLPDLKYAMQHLQARYQFKSNHRAALKSLDQPISETETFQHTCWVYAFRFLKVSLALQVPGRPETASALQQLHAIANHADRLGDRAVFVTCSALEAMIHLRTSGPDHLEHTQRAIAAARSLQLQTSVKQLGSIAALVDCIDIACSLQHGAPNSDKMTELQQKVDKTPGPANGVFSVLIEKSFGGNTTLYTGGVLKKADDGRDELTLSWLPKNDLKILAYYLSGMTSLQESKGVSYLQEGLKLTSDALQRPRSYPSSIQDAITQRRWMMNLDWQVRFALGIIACHHEDRAAAQSTLASLHKLEMQPPLNNVDNYTRMSTYLSGILDQSHGALNYALTTYQSPLFSLPDSNASHTDFATDLAILATMNRLLIIRDPTHPEHFLTGTLFSQLEPLCAAHPNKYFEAAFKIIRALVTEEQSINRQKTLISNAVNASRAVQNANGQFVVMALTYMTSKFFADVMGEQGIKSARAVRSVAKGSRSSLWQAVAYGLCVKTFMNNGLGMDARQAQVAFEAIRERLPPGLRGEVDAGGDVKMEE
ncbi:cohesin loading factor-domain-containing protein [Clohesyomyces aquaticus]|uniref:Cohesin loading factor-domain-containing protein n=1 Tax=Clohesyomyces aquaticus TaxID=1231657 RepID=A0A1Y1ZYZ0_9PLEO|nr:cohesin loading factor-domain-containing protein [Clohesyomyces aquaticus]